MEVSRKCFKGLSRMFQGCLKSRVFQGSFKSVSRKFQECFLEVYGKFHGCLRKFKGVSTKIDGSLN